MFKVISISIWNYSYPGLRVAYIDEVEERDGDKVQKVFYSVLVKALDNHDQVVIAVNWNSLSTISALMVFWSDVNLNSAYILPYPVKEIYRIKLPGPAKLGEGKPENQNHAIIFTRGEALQTIDMNQVNWIVMVPLKTYATFFAVLINDL